MKRSSRQAVWSPLRALGLVCRGRGLILGPNGYQSFIKLGHSVSCKGESGIGKSISHYSLPVPGGPLGSRDCTFCLLTLPAAHNSRQGLRSARSLPPFYYGMNACGGESSSSLGYILELIPLSRFTINCSPVDLFI